MRLNGSVYGSAGASFSPTVNTAVWVLEVAATALIQIPEFAFAGEASSSTPMRTRIARDSAIGTGTRTAGSVQRTDVSTVTPGNAAFFSTTYASTQPTIQAGALNPVLSWNAYGGAIRWLAAPGEEFLLQYLAAGASIECRPDLGTGASSYGVVWQEF